VFFELAGDASIQYVDDAGGDSSMYGHRTGAGVISVAAVPWWDTPEFDTTFGASNNIDPESFTALGGRLPIQFDRNGSFIGDKTVRHPRITAVDGNNTTFFGRDINLNAFGEPDNFPNFFGTSAAAPNAAAVAAGVLGTSAEQLAPGKVADLLRRNTVDVQGARAGRGTDDVTGPGLIDTQAVLDEFPTARASGPGDVDPGAQHIELDGAKSSAPGSISGYRWRQVDGVEVTLRDSGQPKARFDAPAKRTTLVFELVVTGASGLTNADRVSVGVAQELELSGDSGGGGGLGWLWVGLLVAAGACQIGCRRCCA